MPKKIELSLDGTTAIAVLHEQEAPRAVQKFWDALPLEAAIRHVRWSGSAGYILSAALRDPALPLENRTSFYHPGTLNLRPEHGEIAIAYGPAQARDGTGMGWASHVASLEGDASAFLQAVERTQHAGKRQLAIKRRES